MESHYDIFLSCSFSSKVNEANEVDPAYKRYIEDILQQLRAHGLTVFNAMEYEGWIIDDEPPEVAADLDLAALDASDRVLVLVSHDKSDGRAYESGYAYAAGKPVYFMLEPESGALSYWNQGVVNSGRATLITSVEELVK